MDNGRVRWYDLDLPDVIALRRRYLNESDRRIFIAASILDTQCYELIGKPDHLMLMIAGVIYYFTEPEVLQIFKRIHENFPGAEIIFDYSSPKGVVIANKKVIAKGGMDKTAVLKWGIEDIHCISEWEPSIKILHSMPMFHEHKYKYPVWKRLGFKISNNMKIMSLAHLKI